MDLPPVPTNSPACYPIVDGYNSVKEITVMMRLKKKVKLPRKVQNDTSEKKSSRNSNALSGNNSLTGSKVSFRT
jgi:hypothetical protein